MGIELCTTTRRLHLLVARLALAQLSIRPLLRAILVLKSIAKYADRKRFMSRRRSEPQELSSSGDFSVQSTCRKSKKWEQACQIGIPRTRGSLLGAQAIPFHERNNEMPVLVNKQNLVLVSRLAFDPLDVRHD